MADFHNVCVKNARNTMSIAVLFALPLQKSAQLKLHAPKALVLKMKFGVLRWKLG